eukprot:3940897-Rhodomonas_salina.5
MVMKPTQSALAHTPQKVWFAVGSSLIVTLDSVRAAARGAVRGVVSFLLSSPQPMKHPLHPFLASDAVISPSEVPHR